MPESASCLQKKGYNSVAASAQPHLHDPLRWSKRIAHETSPVASSFLATGKANEEVRVVLATEYLKQ